MRVLWLSHFVPWPATGMGMLQRSHHLLIEAARRDEVHLVALNDTRMLAGDALADAGAELRRHCASVELVARDGFGPRSERGVAFLRSRLAHSAYDVEWMTSRAFSRRLRGLAARPGYDVVHADSVGLMPHARWFRGVPIVLTHHNVESAMMERRAELEPSRWRRAVFAREVGKLVALERAAARDALLHLVVSQTDAERLAAVAGAVETRVVPNGTDTGYFAPQLPLGHGDGGLVFAGAMDWYPNRDAMIWFAREIWPLLVRERPARRAVIVGRSAPPEVASAGSDGRLALPGFVDDVRPWLDRASIYVCPIRDGGGTRLKVLDAMAMAKPVVATRLAVEGLGLVEERHYLRAETPADYAAQVRRLEDDGALRVRLAGEGRRLVEERFSWPAIGEVLSGAYRDAAAASSAARDREPDTTAPRAIRRCPDAAGSGEA